MVGIKSPQPDSFSLSTTCTHCKYSMVVSLMKFSTLPLVTIPGTRKSWNSHVESTSAKRLASPGRQVEQDPAEESFAEEINSLLGCIRQCHQQVERSDTSPLHSTDAQMQCCVLSWAPCGPIGVSSTNGHENIWRLWGSYVWGEAERAMTDQLKEEKAQSSIINTCK